MPPENNQNFNQPMPQQPQKSGSGITIVIALLIAIIAVLVYLAFLKPQKVIIPIENGSEVQNTNTENTAVNQIDEHDAGNTNPEEFWNSKRDEIKMVILANVTPAFTDGDVLNYTVIDDVTGDGIPEAFVYYGSGGATTSNSAVMYLKNGNVFFAKVKDKVGVIGNFEVVSGAGAMYSIKYGFVSEKQIVYQTETQNQYNEDGSAIISKTCTLDAYKWNNQLEIFEYSAVESLNLKAQYCV